MSGTGSTARRRSGGGQWGGSAPAEKAMSFGPSARRLLRRLGPERWLVTLVVLLSGSSVALSVLGPKILGSATDLIFSGTISATLTAGASKEQVIEGLRHQGKGQIADMMSGMDLTPGIGIDFEALSRLLMLVLALYLAASVFNWAQAWVINGMVQRTIYRLRADVERKVHRLPLAYFDRMSRGELLSRVTNDIDNIQQSLQQSMSQSLNSLFTVVGVLVMMFVVSPILAVIALVTIPLTVLITVLVARRSQRLFVAQWRHTGELNGQVEEAFTGHALVKVFGRRADTTAAFRDKNEELYRASFGAQFVSGIIQPAMMFIGNLVYVAIAIIGSLLVATGSLRLGDVQAFIQYSRRFTQPLTQLGAMANRVQSGVASAERVFEFLDAEEENELADEGATFSGTAGRLVFDDVSFRYTSDVPLIEGLSFVARPGQTVAIVGPTGAGKTTLVNLMMRFYEVTSGTITLDGVDVSLLSRSRLRSRMGMVLQDTWLFAGTIRENIAYGRPGASDEEIVDAARATHVDDFVRSLPDGYDTMLDDEGANVSAGEKQLLTIARAFLSRPDVLILDEATSSVDTRTELLVQKAMSALRNGRTSFVIAHRLSTIRDADLILVMRHGSIVEQGTHEQLLKARGAYHELHRSQFEGAATDEM